MSANAPKESKKKDKRNLYLAREGGKLLFIFIHYYLYLTKLFSILVIREGTLPAKDLSKSDLNKRVEREVIKRKMLSNLNIFVSPFRLCVHNIPVQMSDKQLLAIFREKSSKTALIKEVFFCSNISLLTCSNFA